MRSVTPDRWTAWSCSCLVTHRVNEWLPTACTFGFSKQIHGFIGDLSGHTVKGNPTLANPALGKEAPAPERPGRVGAIEDAVDRLAASRDDLFSAIGAFRELNL